MRYEMKIEFFREMKIEFSFLNAHFTMCQRCHFVITWQSLLLFFLYSGFWMHKSDGLGQCFFCSYWLIIKICLFENTKRKLKLICMRVLTTNVQSTMHRHMLLANACRQNHINFFCPHNVKKNCKSIALINENTWQNGKFIKQ